jgi:hypothetical protein
MAYLGLGIVWLQVDFISCEHTGVCHSCDAHVTKEV